VATLANLINEVDLMPNYILAMPYMVILSYILVLSLLNTKNWLYSTVKYLNTPISIIIPIKLSAI
jgi:hypothetical protein